MVTAQLGLLPTIKFYINPETGKEHNPYKFSLKIAHGDYNYMVSELDSDAIALEGIIQENEDKAQTNVTTSRLENERSHLTVLWIAAPCFHI